MERSEAAEVLSALHDRLEAQRMVIAAILHSLTAEVPNGAEVARDVIAMLQACEGAARQKNASTEHIDELMRLLEAISR